MQPNVRVNSQCLTSKFREMFGVLDGLESWKKATDPHDKPNLRLVIRGDVVDGHIRVAGV